MSFAPFPFFLLLVVYLNRLVYQRYFQKAKIERAKKPSLRSVSRELLGIYLRAILKLETYSLRKPFYKYSKYYTVMRAHPPLWALKQMLTEEFDQDFLKTSALRRWAYPSSQQFVFYRLRRECIEMMNRIVQEEVWRKRYEEELLRRLHEQTREYYAPRKPSWTKTLGVDEGSSVSQVKQAYRKLASKHHPDRGGRVEDMQRINTAYSYARKELGF